MYNLIDDAILQAPAHMKTAARRNVRKILDDVDAAKKKYTDELQSSSVSEQFWKQVQTARENFNEELHILFPNINIYEKKLSINEEAFDLFVLHMYHKVNNLQKELEKQRVRYCYIYTLNIYKKEKIQISYTIRFVINIFCQKYIYKTNYTIADTIRE